jgi:hypothetical protein
VRRRRDKNDSIWPRDASNFDFGANPLWAFFPCRASSPVVRQEYPRRLQTAGAKDRFHQGARIIAWQGFQGVQLDDQDPTLVLKCTAPPAPLIAS